MPRGPYENCHQPHVKKAVSTIERRLGHEMMQNAAVIGMIRIVESFLKRKKLVCYGGTAINNVLPKRLQFYDTDVELPDYDFFSPDPVRDAKALANIFAKKGYSHVVASAGVHGGTFKVHVDYVPVADITFLDPRLYAAMRDHTVEVDGIHYAPPVYLRALMHLELSRPDGDVSRWDKVANRLALLDQAYPMKEPGCSARVRDAIASHQDEFDRKFRGLITKLRKKLSVQGVVFAGAFAVNELNQALRRTGMPPVTGPVPMVVISTDLKETIAHAKEVLSAMDLRARTQEHVVIGEIIPKHVSLSVNDEVVFVAFEALECHAYSSIGIDKVFYRVATIDTMLTLYLPFTMVHTDLFPKELLACFCNDLSAVAQECDPREQGPLARFDRPCYGTQSTLADIRRKKDRNYRRLKGKTDPKSREEWTYYFMRYEPRKEPGVVPPGANAAAQPAEERKGKGRRTRRRTRKGKKGSRRTTRRRR